MAQESKESKIIKDLSGFISCNEDLRNSFVEMINLLGEINSGTRAFKADNKISYEEILKLLETAAINAKLENKEKPSFKKVKIGENKPFPKFNFGAFAGETGPSYCGITTVLDDYGNLFVNIPSVVKTLTEITTSNLDEKSIHTLNNVEQAKLSSTIEDLKEFITQENERTREIIVEQSSITRAVTIEEAERNRALLSQEMSDLRNQLKDFIKEKELAERYSQFLREKAKSKEKYAKIQQKEKKLEEKYNDSESVSNESQEYIIPSQIDGKEVTVIEKVDRYFPNNWKTLKKVMMPDNVTGIGSYAFEYCTGLTSIVIPDSVTSIGDEAFYNCIGLTDVYYKGDIAGWCNISFGDSNANPMYYAKNLYIDGELLQGELVIPDSVTSIGKYAFIGCCSVTSIVIPNSVTSIGEYAFDGCCSVTSIVIPNSVTSIGEYAFDGCDNITKAIIPTIAIGCFYEDNLQEVIINQGESIRDYAFKKCSKLVNIVIPNSVKRIGSYAFYDCSSLKSILISDNLTSIGDRAFSYCTGLTSITISDSVTSIGYRAFNDCSKLVEVNFKNTQGWQVSTSSDFLSYKELPSRDLADSKVAATYLKETYYFCYWRRVE